jgi:hypothetical protein
MLSCRLPVKIVMAALILLFHAGQVLCSYEFLVSVVGSGQGEFKGEFPRDGDKDKIPGFEFSMQFTVPFDSSTGLPAGKIVASPVTFKKIWGRSTPQFLQAMITGEILKKNSDLNADDLRGPAGLYFIKVSGGKAMSLPVHLK